MMTSTNRGFGMADRWVGEDPGEPLPLGGRLRFSALRLQLGDRPVDHSLALVGAGAHGNDVGELRDGTADVSGLFVLN